VVSAFASEAGIVLGQVKTREKSNEITAIPELLAWLDVRGAIVTIEAMGRLKRLLLVPKSHCREHHRSRWRLPVGA